jgi:hypothetical protein
MPESFEPLVESFSTADAEAPVLAYEWGFLRVRFRDWQGRKVEVAFIDVAAFSWDQGDAACSGSHRDDASYIVVGSDWLQRHIEVSTITASEGHRHYKLCFNAAGVLQVIATELKVSAE